MKGDDGDAGEDGEDGVDGDDGLSAYQLAVINGFTGTIDEWLESLYSGGGVPPVGVDGQILTVVGGVPTWADLPAENPLGVGDEHWANVVLLLKGDNVAPDSSSIDRDPSELFGITINTSGAHYGTGQLYSAGSNGRIVYASSPDFRTDGDWTIEFFIEPEGPGYVCGSSLSQNLRWQADLLYPSSLGLPATPIPVPEGERHHIAISRIGTTVCAFLDGVLQSETEGGIVDEASSLPWGLFCHGAASGASAFAGKIEEFRFTQGVGRWDADSEDVLPSGPYVTGPIGTEEGSGLPGGGTDGQFLSILDGEPAWVDVASLGTYIYQQDVSSLSWMIGHGLGYFPSVTIVGFDGIVVEADVRYVDNDNVTLNFGVAFSGRAYLN